MTAFEVLPPFPVYHELDGTPLEDGNIYIGTVSLNPETNAINVFWDVALTIPAAQPIRTLGGYPSKSGTPASLYIAENAYSITVRDKNNGFIYSDLGAAVVETATLFYATVAEMTAVLKESNASNQQVLVGGRTTIGDGGGGTFYWDSASTATPDDGTIFAADIDVSGIGRWLREFTGNIHCVWFGASAALADNTSALTSAWAAASLLSVSIVLPGGSFKVLSNIASEASPANNFSMIGAGKSLTYIDLTDNTTYFAAVLFQHYVEGVTFISTNTTTHAGDVFRRRSTLSTDTAFCQFKNSASHAIGGSFLKLYSQGNGSKISLEGFTYVAYQEAATLFDSETNSIETDSLSLDNCWIETRSDSTCKLYSVGRLSVTNSRFVPFTNASYGYWFRTTGNSPHVYIADTDFGGESVRKLFDWQGAGGDIELKNVGLYCGTPGALTFTGAAPTFIKMSGIGGLNDPNGLFRVDTATITDALKLAWSKCIIQIETTDRPLDLYFLDWTGATDTTILSSAVNTYKPAKTAQLLWSDFVASAVISSNSVTNATRATGVTDILGTATDTYRYTATANGGIATETWTASAAYASGPNTLEMMVTVTGGPVSISISVSTYREGFFLASGTHWVTLPLIVTPDTVTSFSVDVFMPTSGATVTVSRVRWWLGQFRLRESVFLASAIPAAGTHYKGDYVQNVVVATGTTKGWKAATSGTANVSVTDWLVDAVW